VRVDKEGVTEEYEVSTLSSREGESEREEVIFA
jgi:hypothetical protein